MKLCKTCKIEKPLDDYYFQKKKSKKRGEYIYYNPECKICVKNRFDDWRHDNKDRYVEKKKEWQEKNRKKYLALRRSYDRSEYQLNWQRENKDKIKQYNENRNLNRTHKISHTEWNNCKKYFNNSCAYCEMSEEQHKEIHNQQLHKDHVIHEGRNDIKNCVPSCKNCNSSKGTVSMNNWYNNKENEHYTYERYLKIYHWMRYDVKNYIEKKA